MSTFYRKTKELIKNHDSLFLALYHIRAYAFYFLNRISNYQVEKRTFYRKLGYSLNLKNPQSFNEKIVWKKIYDRNPLLPITADKVQVRSYIKEVLGEEQAQEILIPLLYVTDNMLSENSETFTLQGFPEYTLLHFTSSFKILTRQAF